MIQISTYEVTFLYFKELYHELKTTMQINDIFDFYWSILFRYRLKFDPFKK